MLEVGFLSNRTLLNTSILLETVASTTQNRSNTISRLVSVVLDSDYPTFKELKLSAFRSNLWTFLGKLTYKFVRNPRVRVRIALVWFLLHCAIATRWWVFVLVYVVGLYPDCTQPLLVTQTTHAFVLMTSWLQFAFKYLATQKRYFVKWNYFIVILFVY